MTVSRRTDIINFLVNNLKNIDGGTSLYDNSYSYNSNIFNNVFRKLKFIDEVNDFPSLYLNAGTEFRNFQSENLTIATLTVIIRAYVYGEDNSQKLSDDLAEDIEHIIYNLPEASEKGILDITIESISMDEGLISPYGVLNVNLSIVYRLED